jgi:hypothetical protein
VVKSARALELSLALYDPGIGSLFAVKCFGFAVDDCTGFLDNDLGNEGLGAIFASPSNYTCCPDFWFCRTGAGRWCQSALLPSRSTEPVSPVRLEPKKYDKVVPRERKCVKIGRKRYDIELKEN